MPKDWDDKRSRTKAKPDTYFDDVNRVLNRYQDAATAAHAAGLAGRSLDKDAMRAEIEQRYLRLAQKVSGEVLDELPLLPLPTEPPFLDHFQR